MAGSEGEAGAVRRVVLTGMMAAGKTSVGAELARRLGWTHVDLDREIEASAGAPIAAIFAAEGEAGFRAREAAETARMVGRERVVLSVGGGWGTGAPRPPELGGGTLSVWLRVDAEEAVRRAAAAPGERPLLTTSDPLAAVRELLRARTPVYESADLALPTQGRSVPEIAERILDELRARGTPTEASTE